MSTMFLNVQLFDMVTPYMHLHKIQILEGLVILEKDLLLTVSLFIR